jgi:hypothetical protein
VCFFFFFKNEGIEILIGVPQEETKISARNLQSTALISKKDDVDSFVENDDSVGVAIYFCFFFCSIKTIQILTRNLKKLCAILLLFLLTWKQFKKFLCEFSKLSQYVFFFFK